VEAVDGGEQHQQVGLDEHRGRGRPRASLSPNLISSTETTSFSLMMGMTLMVEELEQGMRALRWRRRSFEVVVGQEDLADPAPQLGEQRS
jgi:hypothetical protein